MKKKVLTIGAIVTLILCGFIAYSFEESRPTEESGVASYGKQGWRGGLSKICCDKSDISKPCSESTGC